MAVRTHSVMWNYTFGFTVFMSGIQVLYLQCGAVAPLGAVCTPCSYENDLLCLYKVYHALFKQLSYDFCSHLIYVLYIDVLVSNYILWSYAKIFYCPDDLNSKSIFVIFEIHKRRRFFPKRGNFPSRRNFSKQRDRWLKNGIVPFKTGTMVSLSIEYHRLTVIWLAAKVGTNVFSLKMSVFLTFPIAEMI